MEKNNKKKKLLVFLDVSIDGDVFERMVFKLFTDVAPKTAENFRALCTGEKGIGSKSGNPLHYKGTFFHRINKGYLAQGGDFLRQDGNFGESIYDGRFPDESLKMKHDGPGLLSMAIADRDERGSLFSITFKADHHLDRKCIVFGELVNGHEVLKKIESAGDEDGRPSVTVKIINSGELHDDKKGNKSKGKKGTVEVNDYDVKRKGKHKKSSKKRRKKRRRHYTSESDSSCDTEMDSSESDSDSELEVSSFSDTSSSSDERRKKRKRTKRERHRRGKAKDRRREKRQKKWDKKSRHQPKRENVSDSETNSISRSISKDNDAPVGVSDMYKSSDVAAIESKEGKVACMSEREEGEFPRENGEHENNGHPDIVDDLPSKSRSQSLSPMRASSKSMSLSPRRIEGRSSRIGEKHNRDRSTSVGRNPQQISYRSRSASPVRSGSSRSPQRQEDVRNARSSPTDRSQSPHSHSISPKRTIRSPFRPSSRRTSQRLASRSPVRSRRSLSSSSKRYRRSLSRSLVRSSHRRVSRSSGRARPTRSSSPSPDRAHMRGNRRSYSRSPVVTGRRPDRGRSSSRSPSVDGSPKLIRRGRGFSDRYSYVRRYRSRSCSVDRSPVGSYHYGARNDSNRYRRSPRRYRSPPRGITPLRYRGRSRSRSPISRSPVRYRNHRYSRSRRPRSRSHSPVDRNQGSPHDERRKSPPRSRSPSVSRSSHDSPSPRLANKGNPLPSPNKTGLVSYGEASPDSERD